MHTGDRSLFGCCTLHTDLHKPLDELTFADALACLSEWVPNDLIALEQLTVADQSALLP